MTHKFKWALTYSIFLFFVMSSAVESGEFTHPPRSVNLTSITMESWAPYYRPYKAGFSPQMPIQWNNPTASPHTVRHDGCENEGPCLFDSGAVAPNESYTIPGLAPGRYFYHCELHPIMRGELIVNAQGLNFTPKLASSVQR